MMSEIVLWDSEIFDESRSILIGIIRVDLLVVTLSLSLSDFRLLVVIFVSATVEVEGVGGEEVLNISVMVTLELLFRFDGTDVLSCCLLFEPIKTDDVSLSVSFGSCSSVLMEDVPFCSSPLSNEVGFFIVGARGTFLREFFITSKLLAGCVSFCVSVTGALLLTSTWTSFDFKVEATFGCSNFAVVVPLVVPSVVALVVPGLSTNSSSSVVTFLGCFELFKLGVWAPPMLVRSLSCLVISFEPKFSVFEGFVTSSFDRMVTSFLKTSLAIKSFADFFASINWDSRAAWLGLRDFWADERLLFVAGLADGMIRAVSVIISFSGSIRIVFILLRAVSAFSLGCFSPILPCLTLLGSFLFLTLGLVSWIIFLVGAVGVVIINSLFDWLVFAKLFSLILLLINTSASFSFISNFLTAITSFLEFFPPWTLSKPLRGSPYIPFCTGLLSFFWIFSSPFNLVFSISCRFTSLSGVNMTSGELGLLFICFIFSISSFFKTVIGEVAIFSCSCSDSDGCLEIHLGWPPSFTLFRLYMTGVLGWFLDSKTLKASLTLRPGWHPSIVSFLEFLRCIPPNFSGAGTGSFLFFCSNAVFRSL